ncbi:MAG TPA: thiamine pyrophosphate-dependent enzyme [bacterium]|nr:thiamine pyrophosphate-dependent enzyme [bacterium]
MIRLEAFQRLVTLLDNEPVLSNLGRNTYDLFAAGHRPQNFYTWGAMGTVSSVGLGLALARPDLRVVVLDGDGSLLMNLGSLATIASLRPANLVHIVCDTATYETTGGQVSHTAGATDLAAIGRGAGLSRVERVEDLAQFERTARRSLVEPGPWLIVARMEGTTTPVKVPRRPIYDKYRFMEAITAHPRL